MRPPRSTHSTRNSNSRGFTLLEVMVALAILALALVALGQINANAIAMHSYAKKLTVATFLARSKMLEVESKLDLDGLPAENENIRPADGDFEEEGFPTYKWKVEVVAPKADNMDPTKLMGAILGGGSDDASGGGGGLMSLLGGGAPATSSKDSSAAPTPTGAGGGLGAIGAAAMAGPAQMMVSQITKMVREVHLTVTWKNGASDEEFTVVEHIVSMGPTAPTPGAQGAAQTTKDPDPNEP